MQTIVSYRERVLQPYGGVITVRLLHSVTNWFLLRRQLGQFTWKTWRYVGCDWS